MGAILRLLFILILSSEVLSSVQVPTVQATAQSGVYFDHLVFIMMENEGIQNMCAQSGSNAIWPCNGPYTPYLSSLANNYTLAEQYASVYCQPKAPTCTVTSQPNYIAIIGGSNFTCPKISCTNINKPTLVIDRLQPSGLSWKAYMESMPSDGCDRSSSQAPYNPTHNPFISFTEFVNNSISNTANCSHIVRADPTSCGNIPDCALLNDLNNRSSPAPNFAWLTPNDCNNMHGSSVCTNGCNSIPVSTACMKTDDRYLSTLVPRILNSYAFNTTRSALFITFDEGTDYCPINGKSGEDCVYAVWAGRGTNSHFPSQNFYNHYSFLKTIEANWNLANLTSNDGNAKVMSEFFKQDFSVTANPSSVVFNASSSSSFTVSVSPVSGFAGTVNLSTTISPPDGLGVDCDPATITLGSGSSSCTLDSSTAGTYGVNVTGTSGSLVHSTYVTVTVVPAVGGVILPVDKVSLMLDYFLMAALIVVALAAAVIVSRTVARRRLAQEYLPAVS